jgi:hypothetical protein
MKAQRMTFLAVAAALVLVLSLFGVFAVWPLMNRDTQEILLPEVSLPPDIVPPSAGVVVEVSPPPGAEAVSPPPDGPEGLAVTRENVQALLNTLTPPENYSLQYTVKRFHGGGSAEWNYSRSFLRGYVKTVLYDAQNAPAQTQIEGGGRFWSWGAGDVSAHEMAQGEPGAFGMDDPQYRDIQDVPPREIVSAELTQEEGRNQIEVRTRSAAGEEVYRLSADDGLLLYYEKREDTQTVYTYTVTGTSLLAPEERDFSTPNGLSVFTEETP